MQGRSKQLRATAGGQGEVRLSEVIAGLSLALDITEGQPMGHAVRSCAIGMRIADEIGLPRDDRSSLFYALLLKDAGCSSNAAKVCALFGHDDLEVKHDFKTTNRRDLKELLGYVTRNSNPEGSLLKRGKHLAGVIKHGSEGSRALIQIRCDRGANIATMLGFDSRTADAIRSLDEHWDGRGYAQGLAGDSIPLLGRILGVAQTVEVFLRVGGVVAACDAVEKRRGTWFDPMLVDAVLAIGRDDSFWTHLLAADISELTKPLEPEDEVLIATPERIDRVAEAFAQVIDAKSPFTYRHSDGVAEVAVGIGQIRGFGTDELRDLRRAALLHDIGKLGVSNSILDKPGKLNDEEWAKVREHPRYTMQILGQVSIFRNISEVAGSHHERLDGRGYHRGLTGDQLSPAARVLAVADVCDALSANRPYREALSKEEVLTIIGRDAGTALCAESVDALKTYLLTGLSDLRADEPVALETGWPRRTARAPARDLLPGQQCCTAWQDRAVQQHSRSDVLGRWF